MGIKLLAAAVSTYSRLPAIAIVTDGGDLWVHDEQGGWTKLPPIPEEKVEAKTEELAEASHGRRR